MKKLLFLLLLSIPAFGQGALFQLGSPPLPGAVIYVCGVPSTGNPCTNTVAIYSNQALTATIPNPYTVNSTGSAAFWVTPGQYTIQIQAPYNIQYIASLGGGGGGTSTPLWSNLIPPSGNLNLNQYQTVTSPFTTIFNAGDYGVSPLTTSANTTYSDNSTSSTDITPDLGCAVPTTSYHDCFLAMIDGFKQFSIFTTGTAAHVGEVAVGSAIDTHSLNHTTYDSKFWVLDQSHAINTTMYDGHASYTGNLLKLETVTAAGTGWNGLILCTGASNVDGSCPSSNNQFILRGDGQMTATNIVDSSMTPSTNPICPHGTGGALTTVGCASGAIPPGVGLVGATVSGTGTTSQSFIPTVDVRWFFTNPFPTYAQAQSQDFGAVLNAALVAATPTGACVDVSGLNFLNAPNIAVFPVTTNIFAGLTSNTYVPCIIGWNFQIVTSVTQSTPGGALKISGGAPGGIGGTGAVIQPCNTTGNCTVGGTTVTKFPTSASCASSGGLDCYATGVPSSGPLSTYTTGTVTYTTGSKTVTGSGTTWTSAMVGGTFVSACGTASLSPCTVGSTSLYSTGRIVSVGSSTSLTLDATYTGNVASGTAGQSYVIFLPNTSVVWCAACLGNNLQKSFTGQEIDNLAIDLNGISGVGYLAKGSQEGSVLNNFACFLSFGTPTGLTAGGTCLAWDQSVRESGATGGTTANQTFLGHFSVHDGRAGVGATGAGGSNAFAAVIEGLSQMDGTVAASQANGASVWDFQAMIGGSGSSRFQDAFYLDGFSGMFITGTHFEGVLNDDINVGPANPVYNVGIYNVTSSAALGNGVIEFHAGTSGNQVHGVSRPSGGSLVIDDNLPAPIVATSVAGTPASWTLTDYPQPGNSGYSIVTGGNVLVNGTISATNYVFNGAPYITGIIPGSTPSLSSSGKSALVVNTDGDWYTSNSAGPLSKLIKIGGSSDVTAQSSSQSSTIVATAPPAGNYSLRYYADVNTACTTGSNTVAFTLSWTDASLARTLTTSTLSMGTSTATSYLSGSVPINVGSGNVTYTSTVTGTCGSGTSSYDVHINLTQ